MPHLRAVAAFAMLFAASTLAAPAGAVPLTVTLTLANLPSSVTLCRDAAAIGQLQSDEQWQIAIDVDNNPNTGDAGGTDAVLVVTTLPQSLPCSPTAVPLDASALYSVIAVWNAATQSYDDGGTFPVAVDTTANTLKLTVDISGALAGLDGASKLTAAAAAGYSQGGVAYSAYDVTTAAFTGTPVVDPSGDVQQCASPCSAGTEYYPMIDIVKFEATNGVPGADVADVKVEFDLAGLPSTITLCRNPALFVANTDADSLWLAWIDVDTNPATGDENGFDAVVFVYTTPQNPGCVTNAQPTASSIFGEIDTIDNQGRTTYAGDAAISIDTASGKITAAVPANNAALKGLSKTSTAAMTAAALYTSGQTPYAQDNGGPFAINTAFSDPVHDLSNCSGSCSTGVSWYAQTDLVGGSIVRADRVFSSGFQ
jgi:hypothetical protein